MLRSLPGRRHKSLTKTVNRSYTQNKTEIAWRAFAYPAPESLKAWTKLSEIEQELNSEATA